jgi:hypothetical protein
MWQSEYYHASSFQNVEFFKVKIEELFENHLSSL